MSSKGAAQLPSPTKAPFDMKELFNDVLIFFAIIGGYLFLSVTYTFNLYESLLSLTLDKHVEIINHYLVYVALTFSIKAINYIYQTFKKAESESAVINSLDKGVNRSMITITYILSVYLLPRILTVEKNKIVFDLFTIDQVCLISFWLLISQVWNVYASTLGELIKMDFFRYFGHSIEIILFLGGVAAQFDFNFFELI